MVIKIINFVSNLIIPKGSSEILLGELLADNTLKMRRWLLVLTVVSFYMSTAHMVPTKISALGIEFNALNQEQFLRISGYVLMYFFGSFFIYACIDIARWVNGLLENRKHFFNEIKSATFSEKADSEIEDYKLFRAKGIQTSFIDPLEDVQFLSSPVFFALAIIRVAWDILLPLIVCIYSLKLLW